MSRPFEAPIHDGRSANKPSSAFVPVMVLIAVLAVWFGLQASQFSADREAVRGAIDRQEQPVRDSKKLRDALDALARSTKELADGGNPNARLIVDELGKRGVTITVTSPVSAPAGAGTAQQR